MTISIRARLAGLGALVVALTVVTFSVVMYVTTSNNLTQQVDANLASRNIGLGDNGPGDGGPPPGGEHGQPNQQYEPPKIDLEQSGDTYIQLLGPTGDSRFCDAVVRGQAPAVGAATLAAATTTVAYATFEPQPNVPVRVAVRRTTHDGATTGFAITGQSLLPLEAQLGRLRLSLVLGTLLSLVGASLLSWWIAGRGLSPLEHMAAAAEEIGRTQDLSRRVPAPGADDEVASLARSFNGMLERLQEAYQSVEQALAAQRRFVAAASHELRTPLTTIRTNAEILERHPDADPAVRREAVGDIAGESLRMQRLVASLLTLARADGGVELTMAGVDLGELTATVVRQARRNHPDRRIDLTAPEHLAVRGADDTLRQLLWILLDNAARHTPAGAAVRVTLRRRDGEVLLEVADEGPGIPPADLERVFERFYRSDPSRSGDGAGLGLSIARWIVAQHGGAISAGNGPAEGAVFTVALPPPPGS